MKWTALSLILLLFAGCAAQKTVCQELQPEVARYFGEELAARTGGMDQNSPQMQFMGAFASAAGVNRTSEGGQMGMCVYNSGKNALGVTYGNASRYAQNTTEQITQELNGYMRNESSYNNTGWDLHEQKVVEGLGYTYYYSSETKHTAVSDADLQTIYLRRGPTEVQITMTTMPNGNRYDENALRDFALVVSRKIQ